MPKRLDLVSFAPWHTVLFVQLKISEFAEVSGGAAENEYFLSVQQLIFEDLHASEGDSSDDWCAAPPLPGLPL